MITTLTVRRAGIAVVTDLGRPGLARHGIPARGACDRYSAAAANLLAGNPEGEPLVEVTASDLEFTTDRPALVAVTGAPATVTAGRTVVRPWSPLCVAANEPVGVRGIHGGLRAYVAVSGRWEVPRVLGSCAPDPQLGTGTWLRAGTTVPVRADYRPIDHPVLRHPVFAFALPVPRYASPAMIDVTAGPGGPCRLLESGSFTVRADSDVVGLRLDLRHGGVMPSQPTVPAAEGGERLSRGVPAGAVELPPSGELLVLLRGRPVTAGYPVLAVATTVALSALGQTGPGHTVRFRHRCLDWAVDSARRERAALDELARRVRTAYAHVGIPHRLEGTI